MHSHIRTRNTNTITIIISEFPYHSIIITTVTICTIITITPTPAKSPAQTPVSLRFPSHLPRGLRAPREAADDGLRAVAEDQQRDADVRRPLQPPRAPVRRRRRLPHAQTAHECFQRAAAGRPRRAVVGRVLLHTAEGSPVSRSRAASRPSPAVRGDGGGEGTAS